MIRSSTPLRFITSPHLSPGVSLSAQEQVDSWRVGAPWCLGGFCRSVFMDRGWGGGWIYCQCKQMCSLQLEPAVEVLMWGCSPPQQNFNGFQCNVWNPNSKKRLAWVISNNVVPKSFFFKVFIYSTLKCRSTININKTLLSKYFSHLTLSLLDYSIPNSSFMEVNIVDPCSVISSVFVSKHMHVIASSHSFSSKLGLQTFN